MWTGKISVTKVGRLTHQLPDGARIWKSMMTDNSWTTTDFLLADIGDVLSWANYQRGGGKGKKPEPIPRPSKIKEIVTKRNRDEAVAMEAKRRYDARRREQKNR